MGHIKTFLRTTDRKLTIALLPDAYRGPVIVVAVLHMVLLSKRVVRAVFSSRSRLHIPVTGSAAFKDPVTACVARLPTNHVVDDPATLLTVGDPHKRTHSLKIQDAGDFDTEVVHCKRPLTPLRFLTHLIDLEFGAQDQFFVDLRELQAAAPQLVRVSMDVRLSTRVSHWHALRNFKMLRDLMLKLWEAWVRLALGPGGALPELRKILHPRQNCLLWDPCPCNDPSPTCYIDMVPFKPTWVVLP